MQDAARVYAEALFDVAREKGKLDAIRERAGPVRRRRSTPTASCRSSSSAPTSPRRRRSTGLKRAVSGAEPELLNFLELLIEKQRMPEIFRIRRRFDELWKRENRRIDVTVTSAVELDPAVVAKIGEEIERQTGQQGRAGQPRRRGDPRRHRPAGRQHGPRREHPQSLGETSKERRPGGVRRHRAPQWRSSPTRSQASSGRGSRDWTPAAPTSPRWARCSPSPTASPASTASTTAWRWRCSSCRTASPAWR